MKKLSNTEAVLKIKRVFLKYYRNICNSCCARNISTKKTEMIRFVADHFLK